MLCPLKIDSNPFQIVKVKFRWTGTKLTEATNRIANIRATGNIGVHQLTK